MEAPGSSALDCSQLSSIKCIHNNGNESVASSCSDCDNQSDRTGSGYPCFSSSDDSSESDDDNGNWKRRKCSKKQRRIEDNSSSVITSNSNSINDSNDQYIVQRPNNTTSQSNNSEDLEQNSNGLVIKESINLLSSSGTCNSTVSKRSKKKKKKKKQNFNQSLLSHPHSLLPSPIGLPYATEVMNNNLFIPSLALPVTSMQTPVVITPTTSTIPVANLNNTNSKKQRKKNKKRKVNDGPNGLVGTDPSANFLMNQHALLPQPVTPFPQHQLCMSNPSQSLYSSGAFNYALSNPYSQASSYSFAMFNSPYTDPIGLQYPFPQAASHPAFVNLSSVGQANTSHNFLPSHSKSRKKKKKKKMNNQG